MRQEFVVPNGFVERYQNIIPNFDMFLEKLFEFKKRTFRVNTLKSSPKEVCSRFSDYGLNLEKLGFWDRAYATENADVGLTVENYCGKIYIQDASSMLPPIAVEDELRSARLVLDCCAAPGSKTTLASDIMGNRGCIIANDKDYKRLRALKHNSETLGCLNIVATNLDFLKFRGVSPDVVLLDPSCSSEGTAFKSRRAISRWSERRISICSRRQKRLAVKAFGVLKPGGVMVYSTCTYAPEENESVVQSVLDAYENAEIDRISIDGFPHSKGIEEFGRVCYSEDIKKCWRTYPHNSPGGGFFLAKIRKVE